MIKFFADSTMDISPEDVKKYDITLVPITVILGDTPYKDGYELNPEKIYDYVKETGNLPKTSACNAETYKEYWRLGQRRRDYSLQLFGRHVDQLRRGDDGCGRTRRSFRD